MARLPRILRPRKPKRATRRGLRGFAERFLASYGFTGDDFRPNGIVRGTLGLYGGRSTDENISDPSVPLPSMQTPRRVSNNSNPTITTIIDQLYQLIKQAKKIGVATSEHQEQLVNQIEQAKRIAREQAQKAHATRIQLQPSPSADLQPLDDALIILIQAIRRLSKKVDQKNRESDQGVRDTFLGKVFDSYRFVGDYQQTNRKRARRARRAGTRQRAANIRSIRPEHKTVTRQRLTSGRLSAGTRSLISSMTNAVRQDGKRIRSLKDVAGPIIRRGLGRTVIKSIPIVGGIVGVAFALERLVKGDPVGAGLEAASGLGSAVTAIPAFAASVARDSYTDVYGVAPEQDPEFDTRMPALIKGVEDLIKQELKPAIQPHNTTTHTQGSSYARPPTTHGSKADAPSISYTPPSSPPAGTPAAGGQRKTDATQSSSSSGQSTISTGTPQPREQTTGAEIDQHGPQSPVVNDQQKSTGINLLTMSNEDDSILPTVYAPGFSVSNRRYMPQIQSTFGQGRSGMGIVPDPNYLPGEIYASKMYFNPMSQNV